MKEQESGIHYVRHLKSDESKRTRQQIRIPELLPNATEGANQMLRIEPSKPTTVSLWRKRGGWEQDLPSRPSLGRRRGEARFVPPPKPRRRLRYSVTRWPRTAGRAAGGRTGRLVDPRGPWAVLPFFRLIANGRLELQVQVCMFGSRPVS